MTLGIHRALSTCIESGASSTSRNCSEGLMPDLPLQALWADHFSVAVNEVHGAWQSSSSALYLHGCAFQDNSSAPYIS